MAGVRYQGQAYHITSLAFLILMLVDMRAAQKGDVQDYCQWQSFNATCGRGEVIMMEVARYGRMRAGRCVSKEYGYVGCYQNVLKYVDSQCSGRTHCQVPVTDFMLQGMRPCPKDVASYFEAGYRCVPASVGDYAQCIGERRTRLTEPSGHISSNMANGALGASCPWLIEVSPGQRVNISLFDFGVHRREKEATGHQAIFCHKYALIKETNLAQDTPICAGRERERNVYVSKGNRVEVVLVRPDSGQEGGQFLLKYEATGCPTLRMPVHGRVHVTGDTATVTCNDTRETWYLRCRGNKWVGKAGNCTHGSSPTVWSSIFGREWSSSHGILIVVGLGIGLGIIIGVILLLGALVCLKRRGWAFGCDRGKERDKPMDMRAPESQYGTAPKGYMHSADSLLADHVIDPRMGNYNIRQNLAAGNTFGTVPGADKSRGMVSRLSEGSLGHIYESPDFALKDVYNMVGRDPS